MSQTRFLIEENNQVLVYETSDNSLTIEGLGVPVFPSSLLESRSASFGKVDNPHTFKIVLGHACNYDCSYCVQKDIGNPAERAKNIMTKSLIKKIKSHIKIDEVERIELWGGETMLYWPDILEIMTSLDREGITWYIPTNGTVLKEKHVEFFASLKGKVTIGISHDGPGHVILRGPEFLHRKVEVFRALQKAGIQFSFNAVISSKNYDLFAINDFFKNFLDEYGLERTCISFELGRTYETSECLNPEFVITGEDIPKYRAILKDYLRKCRIEEMNQEKDRSLLINSLYHYGDCVMNIARNFRKASPIRFHSNCGVDDPQMVTFDINGNLRLCQNASDEYNYGSIENIAAAQLKKVDFNKDDFCKDCHVQRLCKRSCPIKLPVETFLVNHNIEYAHYSEKQLAAFELLTNSRVRKLD